MEEKKKKPKLVVLSGAGMSAESGISTFRGAGGLWEGFSFEEVASPEGWKRHPEVVLDFYNQRRKQIIEAEPNAGHRLIASLEHDFEVVVVTQNIDDLHERAGSTNVLHLHGEIMKAQSCFDAGYIKQLKHWQLNWGELCPKGGQLRPQVVWFGEPVTMFEPAVSIVSGADIIVIVGTSMVVYPAASLINYSSPHAAIYCIDPETPPLPARNPPIVAIAEKATKGLAELKKLLNQQFTRN